MTPHLNLQHTLLTAQNAAMDLLLTSLTAILVLPLATSLTDVELLLSFIEDEELLVSGVATAVQDAYRSREAHLRSCTCTMHSCSMSWDEPAQCFPDLGTPDMCGGSCPGLLLDYNASMVLLAPGSRPDDLNPHVIESLCTYKVLDQHFLGLYPHVKTWTYFGSADGSMRVHPGVLREIGTVDGEEQMNGCGRFEPRLRPWYIAASTGPKDVVILVEAPALREGQSNDWELVESIVSVVLDTLTFADYVNIVVLGDGVRTLWDVTPLLHATTGNVAALKTEMHGIVPSGHVDLNLGFKKAFSLLQDSHSGSDGSSGCSRIILSFTRGEDCSSMSDSPCSISSQEGIEDLLDNIEEMQMLLEKSNGLRASIFTFTLGDSTTDSIPRQISCRNRGAWSHIHKDDDPVLKLSPYFSILAAQNKHRGPVWVDPYEDAFGLGLMTTVAKPVYSPSESLGSNSGSLLGVAAHDILLKELEVGNLTSQMVADWLVAESRNCPNVLLSGCELQVHRSSLQDYGSCPDILPVERCYQFDGRWYQPYAPRRTWITASRICEREKGRLASIRSKQHLAFLASIAAPSGSWIGARASSKPEYENGAAPTNVAEFDFNWDKENGLNSLMNETEIWARGSPSARKPGESRCARIDPRGADHNVDDVDCLNKLSFTCEYDISPPSCGGVEFPVSRNDSFKVPSLASCRIAEDELHTHPLAKTLSSSTALCDMGSTTNMSNRERMCCSDCADTKEITMKKVSYLSYPEASCSPSNTMICVDFITVRNLLLRLCASEASQEGCCLFLRQKRGSLGWGYFKHCVCHPETACDVALFLDIENVFASCGVPLEGIPSC